MNFNQDGLRLSELSKFSEEYQEKSTTILDVVYRKTVNIFGEDTNKQNI